MFPRSEVEDIQSDLNHIISRYERCKDPEVKRIVQRLRRIRKKFDPDEALGKTEKFLTLIDRLQELIDKLPPFF